MNSTARPVPVNTVDRTAFRDMCAHFARREIAPRWQEADRTRTFDEAALTQVAQDILDRAQRAMEREVSRNLFLLQEP